MHIIDIPPQVVMTICLFLGGTFLLAYFAEGMLWLYDWCRGKKDE